MCNINEKICKSQIGINEKLKHYKVKQNKIKPHRTCEMHVMWLVFSQCNHLFFFFSNFSLRVCLGSAYLTEAENFLLKVS